MAGSNKDRSQDRTTEITKQIELTDADRIVYGNQLAAQEKAHVELSAEKKKVMDVYKVKLDGVAGEILHLWTVLTEGHEMRKVKVRLHVDFPRRVIQYLRLESDDLVDERAMTLDEIEASEDADRQGILFQWEEQLADSQVDPPATDEESAAPSA